jgi:hypothetical protein
MEVITIEKQAFQQIIEKLDAIDSKFQSHTDKNPLKEQWLDIQDTCNLLKISKRTLQSYRDKQILPFSQIGGKIYFRAIDIEEHLKRHYNKA